MLGDDTEEMRRIGMVGIDRLSFEFVVVSVV
jgi:hypothetical protein